MDKKENNNQKIFDGRMMQGIVVQWLMDSSDMSSDEKIVFLVVLRNTFGRRKRYAFIKQDLFLKDMSKNTLLKYRKSLVAKGIISFSVTKGFTKYEILKPKEIIDKFAFVGSKTSSESEQYVSSDEDLLVDGKEW